MIEIVTHRGFWTSGEEKNSRISFQHSFDLGFGTETDVRDYKGDLCISHDVPNGSELSFRSFLEILSFYNPQLPLFLNIKSDGISEMILEELKIFSIKNYFTFDMSIPEMIKYSRREGLKFLTRLSDIEVEPILINKAHGIWIDQFFSDWCQPEKINKFVNDSHLLCFVSPELHRRPYKEFWLKLRQWCRDNLLESKRLTLCTDLPAQAQSFFEEERK